MSLFEGDPMSYLDKTFCGSPNCKNECGRQLTPELKARNISNAWISYAYFCGIPDYARRFSSKEAITSTDDPIVKD